MLNYIPLKELAAELGLDKSTMRKYVLKHGFMPVSVRTSESCNQLTLALRIDDAEAVRCLRGKQGFGSAKMVPVEGSNGYFYVIQLVPDLDPNRVKFGFASDVMNRLSAHQTAAPTASLLRAWPCKRTWEGPAIESVTRNDCRHIANEVYKCGNLIALIERCDAFFKIMPSVPRG